MQGPSTYSINVPQIFGNTQEWIVGDSISQLPITPAWSIPANPPVGSIYTVQEFGQFDWGSTAETLEFWCYLNGTEENGGIEVPAATFAANTIGSFRFTIDLGINTSGVSGTCTISMELVIGTNTADGFIAPVCLSNVFAINTTKVNTIQGKAVWLGSASQSLLGNLGTYMLVTSVVT